MEWMRICWRSSWGRERNVVWGLVGGGGEVVGGGIVVGEL